MSSRFAAVLAAAGGAAISYADLSGATAEAGSTATAVLSATSSIDPTGAAARRRVAYLWTHDLNGNQTGVIADNIAALWHDEVIDESELLHVELPLNDVKADLLVADTIIRYRDRLFTIAEVNDIRVGAEVRRVVDAEALWYRLNDTKRVGSVVLSAVTPSAGLTDILSGTGWTVDPTTTTSAATYSLEQQDLTALELVRVWAAITGTVVVFDTSARTVALRTSRGRSSGMAFRYSRNMVGVRRRIRPPEATVLYPYGLQGLTIAGDNGGIAYLEDFTYYLDQGLTIDEARAGFTRTAVWSDDTFTSSAALLAAAEARLAILAQPRISYEAAVLDLSELSGIVEDVAVADTVTVADADLGIDVDVQVARFRRYDLEPWRNEVELAFAESANLATATTGRSPTSSSWQQFIGSNRAAYKLRNDGTFILGRLALRFREHGRGNWHADVFATGVGAGTLHVEAFEALTASAVRHVIDIPYTDGEVIHTTVTWADDELDGAFDHRIRLSTTADGGPSATAGVDLDIGDCQFYVMAEGAVEETPTTANSATFDYTGAVQQFTVPDGVTELTITAIGAAGGTSDTYPGTPAGGGSVTAKFAVTPGSVLDIYVGGCPGNAQGGGWPNGGNGDSVSGSNGTGGGGSSHVVAEGGAITAAIVVAAGGGGQGNGFSTYVQNGGAGGLFEGADAPSGPTAGGNCPGGGATMYAGGIGGTGTEANGTDGSLNAGGDAGNMTNAFGFPGGGGGGGYYGGGGAGANTGAGAGTGGGGGGGAGYVSSSAWDVEAADGASTGNGSVTIAWDTPDIP